MRPIKITEQSKESLLEQFKQYLNNAKLSDNTVKFSVKLTDILNANTPKAQLHISAHAYAKMMMYVRDTTTEIAWHGTVIRSDNNYLITNVFLYPQKLSAATVTTDQEQYNKWLEGLDDDTYNALRFQGHSHVNFGATPSGTDLNFYDTILQVLPKNDYYIFMILNKRGDMTFLIYDLAQNLIYENNDIELHIGDETENLVHTIDLEKEIYCEKPTIPTYNGQAGNVYSALTGKPYSQPQYTGRWEEDYYSETDAILDDIDSRFGKSTLKSKTTKGAKKK